MCGKVGIAKLALPGSAELGENLAEIFAAGCNSVILENHGITVVGSILSEAYARLEALDFCARLLIKSSLLGRPIPLSEGELGHEHTVLPMGCDRRRSTRSEGKLGHELCEISRRAYDQFLFASQLGAASVKLGSETFLITPEGIDMLNLSVDHIVVVRSGHNHSHHGPSRYASIYKAIYESSAELTAIIGSSPPNVMAFVVTIRKSAILC